MITRRLIDMASMSVLKGQIKEKAFLLVIPLIFFVFVQVFSTAKGPFWMSTNFDPDYAYLLNVLKVSQFEVPVLTDHPGTTVEVLGVPIITLTHLTEGSVDFKRGLVTAVLSNPEKYLTVLQKIVSVLLSLVIFLVGLVGLNLFQSRIWALLLQLAPFFSHSAIFSATRFAPEPFLFFTVQCLILVVLGCLKRTPSKYTAALLGCIFGFGLATKVTFLPLLLFTLLMPNWRLKTVSVFSTCAFFLVFTSPIVTRYNAFWKFVSGVTTHTGIYGGGEKGLIDFKNVAVNFQSIVNQDKPFFIFFMICSVLILTGYVRNNRNRIGRAGAVTVLVFVAQALIVAKHPGDIRYMLPAMSLAGLVAIFSLVVVDDLKAPYSAFSKGIFFVFTLACLSYSLKTTLGSIHDFQNRFTDIKKMESIRKVSGCETAYFYASSSLAMAFQLGNRTAGWIYTEELHRIYGDLLTYDILNGQFSNGVSQVSVQELRKKSCLVLQGTPFIGSRLPYLPKFPIQELYRGSAEALYKVDLNP